MRGLGAAAVLLALAITPRGAAALPDHLKCYKIKDPIVLKGILDVDTPQFGPESGCSVSKAKLYCVPATKTVVSVEDRKTGPITPLPFAGTPTAEDRVCYKLKCDALPADQEVTDQFGTRTLTKLKASLVCTPAVTGATYCGDGIKNGSEACDAADLGGTTCASAGFPNGGTLACAPGCTFDTAGCARAGVPVTGQTVAYPADKNDGVVGSVAVADDGTVEAGTPYNYTDNGDGTVTDHNTGLMWEKKGDDGSLHDWDNQYRWDGDGTQETIWDWIDDINAEAGSGFAGHSDWRIPNARELESIQRLEGGTPAAVHPIFDAPCTPGCNVLTCSCSRAAPGYWTSTTVAANPPRAWQVSFSLGGTVSALKTQLFYVRAVRSAAQ